jgi:thymidylate synthase
MPGRHPEYQYLDLMAQVLDHGDRRVERTGVGALSVFGAMVRFDVGSYAPILTTKRIYWKTAVKEMLWFLTGGTNIRALLEANVHIWTDWPLAQYRAATGETISQSDFEARIVEDEIFASRWGELGPVYGRQWRRWQAPNGREFDQISGVVEALRNNPTSRRILFHAWNVADIAEMALPPCHMVYQFHVRDGRLSCMLYQRSVDLLLGCGFNWVGATALQAMLAQQCGLELGELVWVGGDIHLYLNHVEQAREQLTREPRPFPRLVLTSHAATIDDYKIEDFDVEGYDPHPHIKAEIAV